MYNQTIMLSEIIKTTRERKRISLKKLAEKTGVTEKIIIAIEQGDFSNLPAEVFIRGYLKKISRVLKLDEEEIWQEFKKETAHNKKAISQKNIF